MEREKFAKDFVQQYGMRWNLTNWPFDIIEILSVYLRKFKNKILREYLKLISRTI